MALIFPVKDTVELLSLKKKKIQIICYRVTLLCKTVLKRKWREEKLVWNPVAVVVFIAGPVICASYVCYVVELEENICCISFSSL